jgi:hypothetical protein
MRSKMLGLLVVLALLLGTFGSAFAQDEMPAPYCGDLSEEDCALLNDAQAAMMEVSSYQASATYDVMLAGIPGLPADEVAVNVSVDGAFAMDDAALAAAQMFVGKDQQAIMAALAEDATPLADLISGWDADATLSFDITPELADVLSAQAGLPIPPAASVGLMLVDGVLYADLSEFSSLGAPEGWLGIPVGELLQAQIDAGVFEQAAAQLDPANLDAATATSLGLTNMLVNPQQFEQFLTVERSEDVGGAAVFNSNVDVASFVASPQFAEMLTTLADAGAFAESGLTAADIEANLPMVGMMAPMIFADLVVGSSVTVDTTDNYVLNSSSEFSWDLGGLLQMAAATGALPPELDASAPIAFSFTTSVDNSDFNVEQEIEAPADAMMIPAEAFYAEPAQ